MFDIPLLPFLGRVRIAYIKLWRKHQTGMNCSGSKNPCIVIVKTKLFVV